MNALASEPTRTLRAGSISIARSAMYGIVSCNRLMTAGLAPQRGSGKGPFGSPAEVQTILIVWKVEPLIEICRACFYF